MNEITTPYYLIDTDRLNSNLKKVSILKEKTGCHIIMALKGFSEPYILSDIAPKIDGTGASGLYEARMGREIVKKFVFTYSPAFEDCDIDDILKYSDAISFNSYNQYRMYNKAAYDNNCSCGVRLNPKHSTLPDAFKANPCKQYSRLGAVKDELPPFEEFREGKIEGIHIHTMCEQYTDALKSNIKVLVEEYDAYLSRIKWINLGGGQLIGKDDYNLDEAIEILSDFKSRYNIDVILEPCTGIVADCGFFVTSVVDIVRNEKEIAVINGSAVCHIPDVSFIGWRHDVEGDVAEGDYNYIIAGNSCYASDIWGTYSFNKPLQVGDRIVFKDAAMYSMVKANFFNGLKMPKVAVKSKEKGISLIKEYNYDSFIDRQF